jgi:glyoxylase I family protein
VTTRHVPTHQNPTSIKPSLPGAGDNHVAPQITGLHHLSVPAADPLAASDWYATVFGFICVLIEEREDEVTAVLLEHPSGAQLLLRPTPGQQSAALSEFGSTVADRTALLDWADHLTGLNIEHSTVHRADLGWALTRSSNALVWAVVVAGLMIQARSAK